MNETMSLACIRRLSVTCVMVAVLFGMTVRAQGKLPREDVVDKPAIADGLCVSNVFQSGMVLQRNKPIFIWGWATPGETVSIRFSGKTKTVTAADDRSWKVAFNALKANEKPQALTVKGKDKTVTLTNVLIGDVWLVGGQSNMEFPISRVEGGALEIASANFPQIRLLTVPCQEGPDVKTGFARLMEWSSWHKCHFKKGYWEVCTPETVYEFSAIGYVFSRRLHKAAQVPIGIIDVSRGGTTVEAWTPVAVLRKIANDQVKAKLADWDKKVAEWDPKKELDIRIERHHARIASMKKQGREVPADLKPPTDLRPGPGPDKNRPGNCYAGMIAPLAGLAVKGAIFHQGFNNCGDGVKAGEIYYHIFPEMINAWRSAFNDPKLPFGILSLCTAGYPQTREDYTQSMYDAGPYIREAQYKTFLDFYKAGDTSVGFVSTFDLRRRWYHPQLKVPAGERIAQWALATQYGFGDTLLWKPPMVTETVVKDGKIQLKLDATVGNSMDGEIEGFAIAGEDRKFHPADVSFIVTGKDRRGRPRFDRKQLLLSSPMVPNPVHYRYAWGRNPMGNLQITQGRQPPFTGVRFATQRSDDWDMNDIPKGVLGDNPPDKLDRKQSTTVRNALKAIDEERRLKEAQVVIEARKETPKD